MIPEGESMRERRLFFITVVLLLLLDQFSKALVVSCMDLGESIPVIKGFFHITFILNPGASFGILANQIFLFVALTLAVIAFIFWLLWQKEVVSKWQQFLLGLITGGAMGNLIDRVRQGAVIDFIDFRGIWPYIFNVADIGVVVGGLVFAAAYLRREQTKEINND